MLINFTEIKSKNAIAINPNQVVSVFLVDGSEDANLTPYNGKTAIVFTGGNVIVDDSYLDVVGRINGELMVN
jgi:hypothetical protein